MSQRQGGAEQMSMRGSTFVVCLLLGACGTFQLRPAGLIVVIRSPLLESFTVAHGDDLLDQIDVLAAKSHATAWGQVEVHAEASGGQLQLDAKPDCYGNVWTNLGRLSQGAIDKGLAVTAAITGDGRKWQCKVALRSPPEKDREFTCLGWWIHPDWRSD